MTEWRIWCREGAHDAQMEPLRLIDERATAIPLGTLVDESRWMVEPLWTAQALADLLWPSDEDGNRLSRPKVVGSPYTEWDGDRLTDVLVIVETDPGKMSLWN